MIKIENVVLPSPEQIETVIMGMRNPKNSWDRSDSELVITGCGDFLKVGEKDKDLMERLANGGPVHAKYRRMIPVYATITAPLYWWKEFDTNKVGTVSNSCSTMHKIADKEFEIDDFSHEHLLASSEMNLYGTIRCLNYCRDMYLNGGCMYENDGTRHAFGPKNKDIWWQMIQLLPSSYNQKRTIMLNYEVLANIYKYRKDHKLDEWKDFCKWIESLPMAEGVIYEAKESEGK